MSEIPKLSGEWNSGYTRAIMDMQSTFEEVIQDLQRNHKRINNNYVRDTLKLCLEHREALRENMWLPKREQSFVRWNPKKQELEFYTPKKSP